jgi:protein-tyrosine phosphatase
LFGAAALRIKVPMPEVIYWTGSANAPALADRAAQTLREGGLVAFPTETVYGIAASALDPQAVGRLIQCKGRPDNKPLTLAISGADHVLDWLPRLGSVGRRLARRCWPGPVTIVSGDGIESGLATRLPETVGSRVTPEGRLGLRVPAHDAVLQTLHALPGPIVLTSANRSGESEAVTPEAVCEAVGTNVDLVVADGPSRYQKASTVVEVAGESWKILREGVVAEATLTRLASCIIVFVCTGNTCRSPMAEALFKKLLADRVGCTVEQLPSRGFCIRSAGLAAVTGGTAAAEAIEAARDLGADLRAHVSRPLTSELALQADLLIAMTRGHLTLLAEYFPRLRVRPRLLSSEGTDIPDPVGGDQAVYRSCARQILSYLEKLLPEVMPP